MHGHPHVERTRRHQQHREAVMRRDHGVCHICGQPAADAIDHIVPVAWGGSDDPTNLAPAHTSCNSRKRDARPDDWTWNRPSMWLPGYGPNAGVTPGRPAQSRRSRVGFWSIAAMLWGVIFLVIGLAGSTTFLAYLGFALVLPFIIKLFIAYEDGRHERVMIEKAREAEKAEQQRFLKEQRDELYEAIDEFCAVVESEPWGAERALSDHQSTIAEAMNAIQAHEDAGNITDDEAWALRNRVAEALGN